MLPFSAALAGRLLGGRLLAGRLKAARLAPLLLVVLLGYLAGLALEITQPPAAAQDQQLASWLAARHLHTGLSGYWESNVVTLTSSDRVRIRAVAVYGGRLNPGLRELKEQWYEPDRNTAGFVVLFPGVPGYPGFTQERAVLAAFGNPARTYHVGSYTVLVWNSNLLSKLSEASAREKPGARPPSRSSPVPATGGSRGPGAISPGRHRTGPSAPNALSPSGQWLHKARRFSGR